MTRGCRGRSASPRLPASPVRDQPSDATLAPHRGQTPAKLMRIGERRQGAGRDRCGSLVPMRKLRSDIGNGAIDHGIVPAMDLRRIDLATHRRIGGAVDAAVRNLRRLHASPPRRQSQLASAALPGCRQRPPDPFHPELSGAPERAHHPGGFLRRQRQGARAAAIPSRSKGLARHLAQGRVRAGGHRHRAVHAPARRSRRLEHPAGERPLGADVPEGALPDRAARVGLLAQRRPGRAGPHRRFHHRQRVADHRQRAGRSDRRRARDQERTSRSSPRTATRPARP